MQTETSTYNLTIRPNIEPDDVLIHLQLVWFVSYIKVAHHNINTWFATLVDVYLPCTPSQCVFIIGFK